MVSSILSTIPVTATGAGLLGTAGSGATGAAGILSSADDAAGSLFGNLGSTNNSLFSQIEATANQRLVDIQTRINEIATQRNDAINTQNERWISVKAQVNNAQIAVENGQEAIQKVNSNLLDMRTSIANIGQQGEDPKYWRELFDQQVNKINLFAENGGPASNLVGNLNPVDYSPNQIEYRNNLGSGATTLTGTYIGNDFRIEANDGTVWVPDTQTDIITSYKGLQGAVSQYTTGAGQTIDKATSTRNGLKLLSYDAKTGNISMQVTIVPEDGPITVTGKLVRAGGVHVMQSWFYNNFATAADRTRAQKDIDASEVDLVSANATLQTAATQTATDQKHVDAALSDLSKQTVQVRNDQQTQIQNEQIKAAQQYQAMKANLANLQSMQKNYLDAFAGFVDDPFAQASLNLSA